MVIQNWPVLSNLPYYSIALKSIDNNVSVFPIKTSIKIDFSKRPTLTTCFLSNWINIRDDSFKNLQKVNFRS